MNVKSDCKAKQVRFIQLHTHAHTHTHTQTYIHTCVFILPTYLFTESACLLRHGVGTQHTERHHPRKQESAMEDRAAGIEAIQPIEDGANNGLRVRRRSLSGKVPDTKSYTEKVPLLCVRQAQRESDQQTEKPREKNNDEYREKTQREAQMPIKKTSS